MVGRTAEAVSENDNEAAEAAVERVEEDVERLVEDLHAAEPVLKSVPNTQGRFRGLLSTVEKAFRGLFRQAESIPEGPRPEELEAARALMVKFDSDHPPIDVLANGLRTLLERLGNPVMISEDFGNTQSPWWKYEANETMSALGKILEAKKTIDPARGPLYDQAIRLTHAIQSVARHARQSKEAAQMSNAFLRQEDFSNEMRREQRESIAKIHRERQQTRDRQDASIRQVLVELEHALSQVGFEFSDRDREFLNGVKDRVLNFEQFLMANDTFNEKTREGSIVSRIREMTVSSNETERQWAVRADMLMEMLKDLTARGSKIESVVVPSRPRRAATRRATGTDGEEEIAAK